MAHLLQHTAIVAFAGLMAVAAFEDFRRLVIPNAVPIALCALWPLYFAGAPSLYGAFGALACALIVFLAGTLCFSRGWLGGGDVKLLAVATLWAGPGATLALLATTGVLGGALGLFLLMPPAAHFATVARAKLGPALAAPGEGLAAPIPYGIAIAGAAVIVIVLPQLS
jgi:prepilin peptidase CpaA